MPRPSVVPVQLIHELLGYKAHSGAANQAVAALKSYGFVEIEGDGKSRKARISDTGYRVLMKSQDRPALLKSAALAPTIHKEIWEKYSGDDFPSNELLRHYLTLDREGGTFNPETVDSFIDNFRGSLEFSGLLKSDVISGDDPGEERELPLVVKTGDLVQWTCNGADQFPEPRKVLGLSNDGAWAFVAGTKTGLPVGQLTVVGQTMDASPLMHPPLNPYSEGGKTEKLRDLPVTLPKSLEIAYFRVPVKMSETDFKAFSDSLAAMKDSLVEGP